MELRTENLRKVFSTDVVETHALNGVDISIHDGEFVAILIALMGVFGLVFFETQYRRREIAVRRVHGAKIGQILQMFVGQYAKMVLVAFLFAVPVSYLIMQRWLQGYAYHIPLYWWVFALALLIVLAVTSAIVLARSWHAAKENPVEALYKE